MTPSAASRLLVLGGHPDAELLRGSLAAIAAETAEARGATVRILHLSAMSFDPYRAGGVTTWARKHLLVPETRHPFAGGYKRRR